MAVFQRFFPTTSGSFAGDGGGLTNINATTATSASYAVTASYAMNGGGEGTTTGSFTGSFTGSLNGTASYALTASYVTTAQTASFVTTAQTASYVQNAQTASYVTTAQTASYVSQAVSSSYASTISYDSISGSVKNDVYVSTMLSFTSISPADSTTYYIGYTGVPRTTNTDRDFPFPLTGIITDIDFYHIPTGLNGSADASTLYFENITQATSTNLGTFNISQGAQILRTNSFSGLSIAVTKGDSCVLRWDSAAWATNPTNVIGGANIITKRS